MSTTLVRASVNATRYRAAHALVGPVSFGWWLAESTGDPAIMPWSSAAPGTPLTSTLWSLHEINEWGVSAMFRDAGGQV
jgi:hypothetical protein